MDNEGMLKQFVHSYVYAPFLGASFLLALMLLFYRDLNLSIQTIFVPALAVYAIGALLIGYLYYELDRINCVRAAKNNEKPGPQPAVVIRTFRILHGIWFVLFVTYLFCKSVL